MIVQLNIMERNSCGFEPYRIMPLIEIDDDLVNDVPGLCQDAYNEYFATLLSNGEYVSEKEALDDGICFGSCFSTLPEEITVKHGFRIIKPAEFEVDWDGGFKEE